MSRRQDSLAFGLSAFVLFAIGSALIAGPMGLRTADAPTAAIVTGAPEAAIVGLYGAPPVIPKFTYVGVSGCMGEGCHNDEKPAVHSGKMIGDEYTIWFDHDPHHGAFDTLYDDPSVDIAEKLNIEDAGESERCISCHATSVPEPQRGERFDIEQGVGCETCHGPSEKYLEPHATEGWTAEQRGKSGAAGLLKDFGLIDTTALAGRANMCVSCHLEIDKDMLDAGHPALQFEMYSYNFYTYNAEPHQIHWDDSKIEWIDAKLWAIGQVASLDASKRQVDRWKSKTWDTAAPEALVAMYSKGAAIAKARFGADSAAGLVSATYSADACKAAAADLAALAPEAKTQVQRKNIAFGVMALGDAYFKGSSGSVPDAFSTAAAQATKGDEGDAWQGAVKAMADLIGK